MRTSPRPGVQRGRVLAVVAVVAVVAATAAVVLRVSPWAFDLTGGLTPSRVRAGNGIEEIDGRVIGVERDTRTVLVSSGIFGFGATPLALSDDTRVFVGEKEGAFGDLREGTRVRASYEVRQDTRVARTIEVVRGNEPPRQREALPPRPATVEISPAAAPTPSAPSPPTAADTPPTSPSASTQTRRNPAVETRVQRSPAALRAAARSHPAPLAGGSETRRATPPDRRPEPSIATPRSPEAAPDREGADSTAVIDWLLKERR
jgi:hypothetical protein